MLIANPVGEYTVENFELNFHELVSVANIICILLIFMQS